MSGPFWGVVSQSGQVIALQILERGDVDDWINAEDVATNKYSE